MLTVEEVTEPGALNRYREEWDRLHAQSESQDFFSTYEWISTWLGSFWRERPIAFMFFRDNGSVTGLAPLLCDKTGAVWCRGSMPFPINRHARRADFLHVGDPVEALDALLARLSTKQGRFRLAALVMQSSAVRAALDVVMPRHAVTAVEREAPGSMLVRTDGGWDAYLKSRSRHVRSELRRKMSKFERSGRGRWRVVSTLDDCDDAIDAVLDIERRSWKAAHGEALTASESIARFYRELARTCAGAGWLRIHLLEFDDRPIAYVYGVVYENEFLALKTSYDQDSSALSPGAVLFGYALRDAFALGLSAFDFLGEEARWKRELATDVREHMYLCVVPRWYYRCMCCRFLHTRVKPVMKRHTPVLLSKVKKLQRRFAVGSE